MFLKIFKCFTNAVNDMINHDGIEHAGYLSFLLMLAIFPFMFFFMAIIGTIGDEHVGNKLTEIILASSWAKFIDALKPRILELIQTPPQSLLTIAVLSAIWTASSIFEGLRTVLNRAYRVTSPPAYVLRRLLSIGEFFIVITFMILLVTSLIMLPNIIIFYEKFISYAPVYLSSYITPEVEQIRVFLLITFTLLFVALIYYTLPNRKHTFKQTIPGAILVFIGWYIFALLFKYYVNNFPQVNLIYGSIAGIIIALLYFYFCSIILIVGAEFNYQVETLFKEKKK